RDDLVTGVQTCALPILGLVTEALARFGSELRVMAGLEELSFPMLALGAAGLINAVGNLAPRKVAALYRAVAEGKLAEARRLHFRSEERRVGKGRGTGGR